jgi:predicted nucleotidyltransferase
VKRSEATRRILTVVERVVEGGELVEMVDELYAFGSYARGASTPNDVDLCVQFTMTPDEQERFAQALLVDWRDRHLDFRNALRGNWRNIEVQFNQLDELRSEGFDPLLLWRRGEPVDAARERLEGIREDPTVESAERDPVIPALQGLEKHIHRPDRELLAVMDWLGALTVSKVQLEDGTPRTRLARQRIKWQWKESNPRRRAALAAAHYLEAVEHLTPDVERGMIGTREVNILNEYGDRADKALVYFKENLRRAVEVLSHGSDFTLVVLNPASRKRPLVALRLGRSVSIQEYGEAWFGADPHWGGEPRKRLIDRLNEEHEKGSLPETLQALARSLGTRGHHKGKRPVT